MLAKVFSSAVLGIDACRVEVEVDISSGLPAYTVLRLPERRTYHASHYSFG